MAADVARCACCGVFMSPDAATVGLRQVAGDRVCVDVRACIDRQALTASLEKITQPKEEPPWLSRSKCDNPECEKAHVLEAGDEADFVPAGWWELGRAAEVGGHEASYVLCSLDCVVAFGRTFVDTAGDVEERS